MKNIRILLAFGAMALAASTQAASVTAPAGATFTVGTACTVQGSVPNLGVYTAGQTVGSSYVARQGIIDGDAGYAYTPGTDALSPLMTVNCAAGTNWVAHIDGAQFQGNAEWLDPTGNAFGMNSAPMAHDVNGTPLAVATLLRTVDGLGGVGTGAAQVINGRYPIFCYPGECTAMKAIAFNAGVYTTATTARVDF